MKEFRATTSRAVSAPPAPVRFARSAVRPTTRRTMVAGELLLVILVPAALTMMMWATTMQDVSALEVLCAWVLACFPWGAYVTWRRQRQVGAPIFVFVSAMYWLFYACALFYGDRSSPAHRWSRGDVSADGISSAMILSVIGVACLWAGTQFPFKARPLGSRFTIVVDERKWNYLRAMLLLGAFLGLYENSLSLAGEGGRQILSILQNALPLVAFFILFRHYLRGQASRLDKVLLALFVGLKFVIGISGGWLGTLVFVVLGCFLIYTDEKRRPPYAALIPVLFYIVFFQAGKNKFRTEAWHDEGATQGVIERIETWSSYSLEAWQEAFDDQTGEKRTELLRDVVMRSSLLTQTAHVLDNTPSQVPFQYGSTYSYLLATWIPRAFWPDKPSASEANRFYQLAYGLSTEADLTNVSFAFGSMTEGYINFGWTGVVVVMFGTGVLFRWVQLAMLTRDAGIFWNALGITLLLNFILIESQLAFYLGGVTQQTLLVLIFFIPLMRKKSLSSSLAQKNPPAILS